MDRLMLLDGNGLIYRGYFALIEQPLTTSKGELVSAVFGFTNIVLRAYQDVGPTHVAVAFDLPAPTFRHERFAEYKATRTRMPDEMREQIPKVRRVVAALGIPIYEMAGFEADDVIATLVGQAEAGGLDTTILTGDLDMLQLVSERTKLLVSLRGGIANTVAYDLARIDERWGLRPDQMLDYKALKGDPTDNIPGVPGVGEKTAAKLVATYGTLDAMYEAIDDLQPEKLRAKLIEAKEIVLESRELMRLVRDLPVTLDLESGRVGEYDRDEVIRIFREYEFRTLIDRLPPLRGEAPEEAIARLREIGGTSERLARPARARPPPPRPRPSGDGLQLSLDFDAVGGAGGCRGRADHRGRGRRPSGRARGRRRGPASARGPWASIDSTTRSWPGWRRRQTSASRSSPRIRGRSAASRSRSRWPARTVGRSSPRRRGHRPAARAGRRERQAPRRP